MAHTGHGSPNPNLPNTPANATSRATVASVIAAGSFYPPG